jgi:hypothetical protein
MRKSAMRTSFPAKGHLVQARDQDPRRLRNFPQPRGAFAEVSEIRELTPKELAIRELG